MLATETIIVISLSYIGILFAVAYYGDKRAEAGQSIIANPYTYALSMAVYCTAWTFYGSVGLAVRSGIIFLTIYIGPTLMVILGWLILRKIIRITRVHRITSIADFIASRYGKSMLLGGMVTVIAVLGIIPYISLQLKAISTSFLLLSQYPQFTIDSPLNFSKMTMLEDTTFYITLILAIFAILFGTRHLESTERNEGLVAAIALESLVKLIAFLVIGLFVTYGIYKGLGDLARHASENPELKALFTIDPKRGDFVNWSVYLFLSMMAILFLPRQFQVTVIENVNEDHLNKAIWLFPLYLIAINLFVLPVAFAGMLQFSGHNVDADTFVLALPMAKHHQILAILVFLGGMSAATGMVIVETIALSTMICNNLIMPILLHVESLEMAKREDMGTLLFAIRHLSIVIVLLLGYAYFHFTAQFFTLVSIGLVSFTAVAQFGPAFLGGLFWKRGTRIGALCGLSAGFCVWLYTLILPDLAAAGILPSNFIEQGPFGIAALKPFGLFGLKGFDNISHAVFWSILMNTAGYIIGSLFSQPTALEHTQAALFVDVFRHSRETEEKYLWRGTATVPDLTSLLERFLGRQRTEEAILEYTQRHNIDRDLALQADSGFVNHVERLLSGAIGSATARVMVASVVKEEPLGINEVMDILDETKRVIIYSRELEKATDELRAVNERLKELDKLKDDFISTVSHELRTPLTSILSLSQILHDYPETDTKQQKNFLSLIIKETQRLTRLINQVLDFQIIESGRIEWRMEKVDLLAIVRDAAATTRQLAADKELQMKMQTPKEPCFLIGDRDQLMLAMVNLISNAVKFCEPGVGEISIELTRTEEELSVAVRDNGIGISKSDQSIIFKQFMQVKHETRGRPSGSGLGLPITKRIIDHHSGRIEVQSELGRGSSFTFHLPALSIPMDTDDLGNPLSA
jgi:Na+/proline symporter/nitrogen-specific signal transduction histidine kinase